jgi:hypothetical protein
MFEKLCDICTSTEPANVHVNELRSVQSCPICGRDNFVIPGRNEELLVGMSELWIPQSIQPTPIVLGCREAVRFECSL